MASILCVAGCARQAHWYGIESAAVAPDGRTITATIVVGAPGSDGKSCREVTDTDVAESADEVVIGIEVRNNCEPIFPWEKAPMQKGMGYPLNVQLHLTKPLAGRRLVDRANHRELS
ncbi:hypothetical protein ACIBF6_05030 [Streptosporangium amethystogenes]|uniref:hypothetical protein n=1 Tax=Streptosporangium amethystogenes TaxID=2002 RepID=UPI00378A5233